LPAGWDAEVPRFPADAKGLPTRKSGGQVLSAIARNLPALTGGSADLDPSTYTAVKGTGVFSATAEPDEQGVDEAEKWGYAGRNLHFGVREHAMGSIANGMAAHGGTIPYTATFMVFSDYMRPPMRLAVEAGASQGWARWVGDAGATLTVDRYGASAPGELVLEKYGFTVDNVIVQAKALLGKA
jgi:transketolase